MDADTAALAVIGRQQARFDGSDITVRTLAGRRRACAARGNLNDLNRPPGARMGWR
jgi:hypothetical protein